MTTTEGAPRSDFVAHAGDLASLAQRIRALAPSFEDRLRRLEVLGGPDTWQGRIAEVFLEDVGDQRRRLERMDDLLALLARRLELRSSDLLTSASASTGEGDLPG